MAGNFFMILKEFSNTFFKLSFSQKEKLGTFREKTPLKKKRDLKKNSFWTKVDTNKIFARNLITNGTI